MNSRVIENIINIMRKATLKGDEALAYAEAMQHLNQALSRQSSDESSPANNIKQDSNRKD